MNKIYLIKAQESSRYKIGISKNPQKRVSQLQTGNSEELELIETYETDIAKDIEPVLHRKFSHLKTIGEWFELTLSEEVVFIEECKKIEEDIRNLRANGNIFI